MFVDTLHISRQGYVYPTERADDLIFQDFYAKTAHIPDEYEAEAMFITDKVVDLGFEAGWFFDKLSDEKISVLIHKAREGSDVSAPYSPEFNTLFDDMARKAIDVGSHACRMTYVKLMNGDEE